MTKAATLPERYGSAVASGDMGSGNTAVLAAVAWSDREIGTLLFRARAANDAAAVRQLRAAWPACVARMALRKNWSIRVPASTVDGLRVVADIPLPRALIEDVAHRSIEHWLFSVCPECAGRGYRLLRDVLAEAGHEVAADSAGRESLSDHACPVCHGRGTVTISAPPSLLRMVSAAVGSLQSRYLSTSSEARKHL